MANLKSPDSNVRWKWSAILWAYRRFAAKIEKTSLTQLGLFTRRIVSSKWTSYGGALPEIFPNFSGRPHFQRIVRHAFTVFWLDPRANFTHSAKTTGTFFKPTL